MTTPGRQIADQRFGIGIRRRATSVMAMVVDARAFGALPKRTSLHVHHVTIADALGWLLLVLLIGGVIVLNILHLANRQV